MAARGSDDRTVWLTASAFGSCAACQFEDHSCPVWPLHELCQYGGDVVAHIAVAGGAAIGETEDKEREGSEAGGDKDAVRRAWAESDSRRVGVRKVSRNSSDAGAGVAVAHHQGGSRRSCQVACPASARNSDRAAQPRVDQFLKSLVRSRPCRLSSPRSRRGVNPPLSRIAQGVASASSASEG